MKQAAEAALRLQPELGDAQMALAYYHYFGFRDYERAREKLEVARRATPNDAEIYDALGAISRRQGKWEEALANFEKALELDPRNPSVIWNLAETCALLGRAEEAERTIGHGLEVNPDAHLFPLLRGTMALRARGETAPLRAELRKIPREFDPGGGVSLVAVRLALMERDAAEARRLLSSTPHERFNDNGLGGIAGMLDGYSFPRAWLEGLIAHARGEEHDARRHFEEAREDVQEDLDCCPEDPKAVMVRGLIHAALGQRAEAVSDGEEAVRMLPIKRDAYDGPVLATNLAAIYAQVGEKARALDLLESLRRVPMAATAGTLRVEPEWDGLRGETRFRALL